MAASSISHRWKYDVFVSFRGEDIRKGFVDHLFKYFMMKGIHAFRDDYELPKGEEISPQLYKAIEESRFLIVIFSQNYASSSWCLRELVKILECKQWGKPKHEVQIIFYDVKPDVVRKQKGSYAEAFAKHEISYSSKVAEWKKALSMAADLSGWDLQDMTNGYESKFIRSLTNEILKSICHGPLDVGENIVGVNARLNRLNLLQFVGSTKVNMIGICGVSGIGKTTLAKAIYNSMYIHFDTSCFCEDVQGVSKRQGLTQVQNQLIDDIMKTEAVKISNVGQGIVIIKKMMLSKPILLVLDNVDNSKQLEALAGSPNWFFPGSLIIFTGKDKQLLRSQRVDEIHMDFLNDDESLELFSAYAFQGKRTASGFEALAENFVKYVQGHPLALKVLGGFLFGKTVGEWVSELDRLKVHPNDEIQRVLRISYDGLNVHQQKILLDIACSFIGVNRDFAASVLDSCNFFVDTNMRVLVDKSLITISSDMSLQMHDLIEAMAREIDREASTMLGKQSRLWISSEIYDVLSENEMSSESKSVEIMDETLVEVESSNTNKGKEPKRRKKRAKSWHHVEEQDLKKGEKPRDVKAKCLHCGDLFFCPCKKHGVTNLGLHLLRCNNYLEKQSKTQTKITFEGGDANKMMAWKFDQKNSKKALAHMIIVDELPFSFVEGSGFKHFQRINQPQFDVPCRGTITQECLRLYLEEKNKLRETLQKNIGKICLTTNNWTSTKKKSYMALTGHFIDNEWNLVKKVLNFCIVDSHRGIDIGIGLESCLNEWGFNNILSISVDNTIANDGAIEFMKLVLEKNHDCLLGGKWIHIRCAAHIVNLIVQDGLKKIDASIKSIRCGISWIKKSGSRIEKFKKCARGARCESTKSLVLDVPTMWNSTYNMLEVAHPYKDAFARYDIEDLNFGIHIRSNGLSVPTSDDWVKAIKLCHFLKAFNDITLRLFGTKYVTSHTLVDELAKIRALLRKQVVCDILDEPPKDKHLYDIAMVMKPKFDKYYGEVENMNMLVYFAFILDPRNKYEFLDVVVDDHYGSEGISVVEKKKDYIKCEFKLFYEDYVRIHAPSSTISTLMKRPMTTNTSDEPDHGDMLRSRLKRGPSSSSSTSELDKYDGESL